MILNYKRVKTFFDENFSSFQDEKGTKNYYNKEGKIVGTGNNKVLTTFYKEEQTKEIYAVSVIRKMYVGNEENQKVIDAMYIQPINELYKGTTVENNFAIKTNNNKEEGILNKIGTIGSVKKSHNGKRILENKDFIIEVPSREYVKRDFFNLEGVYLLNLQTQYKTKKVDYDKVYDYYKSENKWIQSDTIVPGKERARQFIKKRNTQTYDGLMHPVIKRNK